MDFRASCLGSNPFTSCVTLGKLLNLSLLTCKIGVVLLLCISQVRFENFYIIYSHITLSCKHFLIPSLMQSDSIQLHYLLDAVPVGCDTKVGHTVALLKEAFIRAVMKKCELWNQKGMSSNPYSTTSGV